MEKTAINSSKRLYSIFLNFYPKNYRQEFGEEMKYVYSQSLKDAYQENGVKGIFAFWKRSAIDGVKSLLIQHIENQQEGGVNMKKNNDIIMQNKVFGMIATITALILSLPLIAMQFTSEVDWDFGDFMIMGTLLFGMGSVFVLVARKVEKKNRLVVGLAFAATLFLIWVHLAVGIVDSWPFAGS